MTNPRSHAVRRATAIGTAVVAIGTPATIAVAAGGPVNQAESNAELASVPPLKGQFALSDPLDSAAHSAAIAGAMRAAHLLADRRGDKLPHTYIRRLRNRSVAELVQIRHRLHHDATHVLHVKEAAAARARKAAAAQKVAVPAALASIAACESGGNPRAIGGGGAFRGKYQFDYGTWASVGGHGDPAAAPEAEQDQRAAMLYARSGSAPWPVCG